MADESVQADLEAEASLLTESEELLWRNVHPGWVDGGRITSQAFTPTPKDEGMLSTARQAAISAAGHFEEYTGLGLESAGVWGVTVNEACGRNLQVIADGALGKPSPSASIPTGHVSIDFQGLPSNTARKRAGAGLRDDAAARGRQHPGE